MAGCYRDRCFCSFFILCKKGHGCERALTDYVKEKAEKAEMPISQYIEFPECFVRWFETEIGGK